MPTLLGTVKGYPKGKSEWDGSRLITTVDNVLKVQADSASQGPLTIITSLSIQVGQSWTENEYVRAKSVGPAERAEENRLIWHVPIFYTSQFNQQDAEDASKPPHQRRIRRRWSYETIQEPFDFDMITGEATVNSAGDKLEGLPPVDIVIPVLTLQRYEPGPFDPNIILAYANRTNETTFYGAPSKTALVAGITSEDDDSQGEVYQGVLYERVQYVVKFKIPVTTANQGWLGRYVDAGWQYMDSSENKYPFLSNAAESGGGMPQPYLGRLDGSGGALDGNGKGVELDGSGDPVTPNVVLQFNRHKEAELNDLSLGP